MPNYELFLGRAHLLMSGSRDNSVKIWDIPTGKCTASSEIPRNLVSRENRDHCLCYYGYCNGGFN